MASYPKINFNYLIKLFLSFSTVFLLIGCNGDVENSIKSSDSKAAQEIVEQNINSSLPWINNKQLALEKLKENGDAYSMLSQSLKEDREVVEVALKNRTALFMIDKSFAKDKELILLALKHKPEAFNRIDDSLKSDPDILLASLSSRYDGALENLDTAPDELKNNPDFMLMVLKLRSEKQLIQPDHQINNVVLFPYIVNSLKQDKAFIQKAVAVVGSLLCDLDKSYKSNRKLALQAVMQHGNTLICLSEELQKDREIVFAAVNQNGMALLILAGLRSEFINDKEIALAAINQAGAHAFQGVGAKLQNDADIVKLVKEKMGQ